MQTTEILQALGLTENETQVYLANLKLGVTQVANIARFSGIKRTTLYGILEKMEDKGFIGKHVRNNVAYFEALNPDSLFDMLQTKLKNLETKLPELRAIDNKFSNKPKIYFFEGAENVAELYRMEAKDQPEEVCVFSSNADRKSGERNALRKLRNEIYSEMGAKRAQLKLLMNRDMLPSEKAWDKFHGKKIDPKKLNLDISIKVYGNKTQFISMKNDLTGVVIENEDIANTMKSIFEYIYEEK